MLRKRENFKRKRLRKLNNGKAYKMQQVVAAILRKNFTTNLFQVSPVHRLLGFYYGIEKNLIPSVVHFAQSGKA